MSSSDPTSQAVDLGEVTRLLDSWKSGDTTAAEALLPLVYQELHKIASSYLRRERQGHSLDATALVNEAYLRMIGPSLAGSAMANRTHFFAIAAKAVRRILVDHARRQHAEKRIGAHQKISIELSPTLEPSEEPQLEVLAVHQALAKLEEAHPRQAQVIELRFFAGLSEPQVAEVLKISRATVAREWQVGRLLLRRHLRAAGE